MKSTTWRKGRILARTTCTRTGRGALSAPRRFATYQNAGVRAYDISNPYRPVETGALVPAAPERMMDTRPNRPQVIQSCDVFVDAQGIIYSTDYNGGLSVIEYLG